MPERIKMPFLPIFVACLFPAICVMAVTLWGEHRAELKRLRPPTEPGYYWMHVAADTGAAVKVERRTDGELVYYFLSGNISLKSDGTEWRVVPEQVFLVRQTNEWEWGGRLPEPKFSAPMPGLTGVLHAPEK